MALLLAKGVPVSAELRYQFQQSIDPQINKSKNPTILDFVYSVPDASSRGSDGVIGGERPISFLRAEGGKKPKAN